MSARQDVGLRPDQRVGVGRLRATFGAGQAVTVEATKPKPLSYVPNVGFLLFDGEKGQIYSGCSPTRAT